MTKQKALALMNALESHSMNASAVMDFAGGPEVWSVQLDPTAVYTGQQIGALADYVAGQGLTLTAQFTALGVV